MKNKEELNWSIIDIIQFEEFQGTEINEPLYDSYYEEINYVKKVIENKEELMDYINVCNEENKENEFLFFNDEKVDMVNFVESSNNTNEIKENYFPIKNDDIQKENRSDFLIINPIQDSHFVLIDKNDVDENSDDMKILKIKQKKAEEIQLRVRDRIENELKNKHRNKEKALEYIEQFKK